MNHICIVIISFNSSLAVRMTLSSLRKSLNNTKYSLLLIDNGSNISEREIIRNSFDKNLEFDDLNWTYIQLEKNLGFSGGNNIGIHYFFKNFSFTHICLLNSDVILTDHWLDRLVYKNCDIVSPVTNKSHSSQCVPVDYDIKINNSFCYDSGEIFNIVYDKINSYSEKCHKAWNGNTVEDDITFYCVLMKRNAVDKVGFLDEFFFPGGYEDNDYCLRAHKVGVKIYIARDIFIHHWGSASFGKLQKDYFAEHSNRNKLYLENKHGIKLENKFDYEFTSYMHDLVFMLNGDGEKTSQKYINKLYVKNLDTIIKKIERDFNFYIRILRKSGEIVPSNLKNNINEINNKKYNSKKILKKIIKKVNYFPKKNKCEKYEIENLKKMFIVIFGNINNIYMCIFDIHNLIEKFIDKNFNKNIYNYSTGIERFFKFITQSFMFLWNLNGVVFFGGYPYQEREMDGYFQRIRAIDELLSDRWRIYVDHENLSSSSAYWLDFPTENTIVLRITGNIFKKYFVRFVVFVCVLRCRVIYFHSILRMNDSKFGYILYFPLITKVIDIHGVVPEEFRFHNDFFRARFYEIYERLAIRRCDLIIFVSEAMRSYFYEKYNELIRGKVIVFPIFPQLIPVNGCKPYIEGKPLVVYAGGLHKWQQVPKMIDAIHATIDSCFFNFYCPEPDIFLAMLPEQLKKNTHLVVASKTHKELLAIYPQCHYGFILREDDVVNHAACPTKLVEYIAMGIIPIVDCEDIGDFKSLGMQFVRLRDFLIGDLPDEDIRNQMAEVNFVIFGRLQRQHLSGADELLTYLSPTRLRSMSFTSRCNMYVMKSFQKVMFIFRAVNIFFKHNFKISFLQKILLKNEKIQEVTLTDIFLSNNIPSCIQKCDVLVQVDNFLVGGLENVVIDLNEILLQSKFRIILLVLGEVGPAVERARESGINVCVARFTPTGYAELLRIASPKLVLSHYSIQGASICKHMKIPFVQVIHNTYMWFSAKQAADFSAAARDTTAFIAVSSFAKIYSVQRLGIPDEKCVVIPNGIDLVKFKEIDFIASRNTLRAKHGLVDDDFVFLNVGAVTHQKNHIGAIKAFHKAMHVCQKAKFVFLGPIYEQHLFKEIQRYIYKHKLESRVIYAGFTSNAQSYYAMADASVSSAFFEGGPLTLLEAIAANLPTITTESGLAIHFKGRIGFKVVKPHFDIVSYSGPIWDMKSSPECERSLSEAMIKTYKDPIRPDFNDEELDLFDKSKSYKLYVEFLTYIVQGLEIPRDFSNNSWVTCTTSRIRDLN